MVGASLGYKVESEKNLTIQVVTTAGAGAGATPQPGGPTEQGTADPFPHSSHQSQGQSGVSSATITSQNSLMLRGTHKVLGSFGEALFIGGWLRYPLTSSHMTAQPMPSWPAVSRHSFIESNVF